MAVVASRTFSGGAAVVCPLSALDGIASPETLRLHAWFRTEPASQVVW
jgi:hypothetical protein